MIKCIFLKVDKEHYVFYRNSISRVINLLSAFYHIQYNIIDIQSASSKQKKQLLLFYSLAVSTVARSHRWYYNELYRSYTDTKLHLKTWKLYFTVNHGDM